MDLYFRARKCTGILYIKWQETWREKNNYVIYLNESQVSNVRTNLTK